MEGDDAVPAYAPLLDAVLKYCIRMQELKEMTDRSDRNQQQLQRLSALSIDATRNFLGEISGLMDFDELYKPLLPLTFALHDLCSTGATPDLFKAKAMSRPPAAMLLRLLRLKCAWVQSLYRSCGLSRSEASRRLLRQFDKAGAGALKRSKRTIEDWYDRCQPGNTWHGEYIKQMPDPGSLGWEIDHSILTDIDRHIVEWLRGHQAMT